MPGLTNYLRTGQDLLAETVVDSKLGFDIYFPKYVTTASRYVTDTPVRLYKVADRAAKYRKRLPPRPLPQRGRGPVLGRAGHHLADAADPPGHPRP